MTFFQVPHTSDDALYGKTLKRQMLRASGNLSYLEFVRVVKKLWEESLGFREDGVTPKVPLRATGTPLDNPDYPAILYGLELRKTFVNEAKPRHRETIDTEPEEDGVVIRGQRFTNIVKFTVVDQGSPAGARNCEEIIENFEDFMLEFTPVFKELGVSDLVYARRLPDDEDARTGPGIISRSVTYMLTTEKVIKTYVWKLQKVLVDARIALDNYPVAPAGNPNRGKITSINNLVDTFGDSRQNWIPNQWVGYRVSIARFVQATDQLSGTGIGGSADTITIPQSVTENQLAHRVIFVNVTDPDNNIVGGFAQYRSIVSNTSSGVVKVSPPWGPIPAFIPLENPPTWENYIPNPLYNTSTFVIYPSYGTDPANVHFLQAVIISNTKNTFTIDLASSNLSHEDIGSLEATPSVPRPEVGDFYSIGLVEVDINDQYLTATPNM